MATNAESPDIYEWVIIYRDGTHLRENGGGDAPCLSVPAHGPEQSHGAACVRLDESVQGFYLDPLHPGLPFVALQVPEGARPIIFRRRPVYDALRNGDPTYSASLTIVGWQRTVAGQNVKYLLSVAPDGSVAAADDAKAFDVPAQATA